MIHPVLVFIPNIIGLTRVVTMILSFYYCFHDPIKTFILYGVSQGLDAVDGVAARHFDQCSKFGYLLDMLTDRMSTAVLLVVLSHCYPDQWGFWAFLIVLDIVSHWYQMHSANICGRTTHKENNNVLLKFYYSFPYLLICCAGNEIFLVGMYLRTQTLPAWINPIIAADNDLLTCILFVCAPIFGFKQLMNFVQLYDAAKNVLALDLKEMQEKKSGKSSKTK